MKINLTKIKKCDEVWDDMTPCQNGRVCQKCEKTIIDFRELTDKAVAEIHLFSERPVCGIYREDQLKIEREIIKKHNFYSKKWLSLSLGLLGFAFPKGVNGQNAKVYFPIIQLDENERFNQNPEVEKDTFPEPQKYIIYGRLYDKNDDALIGVGVIIKNTKIGVVSDLDGMYEIDVTEQLKKNEAVTLVYQYTGFITTEKVIKKDEDLRVDVEFNEDTLNESIDMVSFGISARPIPKKLTFWEKVKNIFKRKSKSE